VYPAKFSDPSAGAYARRAEAATLLRQGYGGVSSPCLLRRSSDKASADCTEMAIGLSPAHSKKFLFLQL